MHDDVSDLDEFTNQMQAYSKAFSNDMNLPEFYKQQNEPIEKLIEAIGAQTSMLAQLAEAIITHCQITERLLHDNSTNHDGLAQGFHAMASATDKLAQAHMKLKKTRPIRDENDKLIGAEEYE